MNNQLIKQFISNLLEERDFLCWQLSEAHGLINEETLSEIENKHFASFDSKFQEQLNNEAEELFKLIGAEEMTTDNLYVILKCSIDRAEIALKHVINKVNNGEICK